METQTLEYAYGYIASVDLKEVERPVVPDGRTAIVWYDSKDEAEAARINDLRFRTETFLIARPKVQWHRC